MSNESTLATSTIGQLRSGTAGTRAFPRGTVNEDEGRPSDLECAETTDEDDPHSHIGARELTPLNDQKIKRTLIELDTRRADAICCQVHGGAGDGDHAEISVTVRGVCPSNRLQRGAAECHHAIGVILIGIHLHLIKERAGVLNEAQANVTIMGHCHRWRLAASVGSREQLTTEENPDAVDAISVEAVVTTEHGDTCRE